MLFTASGLPACIISCCTVCVVRTATVRQIIHAVLDHVAHTVYAILDDISGCTGTIIDRVQRIVAHMLDILSGIVQLVGYRTVTVGVVDSVIHKRVAAFGILGVRVDII
jgi:phage-related protein